MLSFFSLLMKGLYNSNTCVRAYTYASEMPVISGNKQISEIPSQKKHIKKIHKKKRST